MKPLVPKKPILPRLKDVIQSQSALTQRAAVLVLRQIGILDAGEQAGLECGPMRSTRPTSNCPSRSVLKYRYSASAWKAKCSPKGAEIAALAGEGGVAGVVDADVHAQQRNFGCFFASSSLATSLPTSAAVGGAGGAGGGGWFTLDSSTCWAGLQSVQLLLQVGVLVAQILQHLGDVVQLVQASSAPRCNNPHAGRRWRRQAAGWRESLRPRRPRRTVLPCASITVSETRRFI